VSAGAAPLHPGDGPSPAVTRAAITAVAVLTAINFFNYIDRFIVTALLPDIQAELSLSNTAAGALGTAFIFVYALTSPLFGWAGDRGRRTRWMGVGVAIWSLATGLAGVARSFGALFAARATVGVGEAAYGTITPALLSDYVPPNRRGGVMAIFSAAIPVGSALGYVLGGVLGAHFGWRSAFFAVGFPGLLLALAVYFMPEPERGRFDQPGERVLVPLREAYRELWRSRVYVWTVIGYIAYTFAIGGLAFWMPSYIRLARGLPQEQGMLLFGGITVVTGFVGTLVGGYLGDRLQDRTPNGYVLLSVVSMAIGAAASFGALLARDTTVFIVLLTVGELFIFANTGPVNALIVNTVRPGVRATASATSILLIHLLGDAISPALLGAIADSSSLERAMLVIPAVFVLAGVFWLGSWRRAETEGL
jgi:predicted MFS family arabinose efflux permease